MVSEEVSWGKFWKFLRDLLRANEIRGGGQNVPRWGGSETVFRGGSPREVLPPTLGIAPPPLAILGATLGMAASRPNLCRKLLCLGATLGPRLSVNWLDEKFQPSFLGERQFSKHFRGQFGCEGNRESKIVARQWGVNFRCETSRCLAGPSGLVFHDACFTESCLQSVCVCVQGHTLPPLLRVKAGSRRVYRLMWQRQAKVIEAFFLVFQEWKNWPGPIQMGFQKGTF